jgi:hypothetical protein
LGLEDTRSGRRLYRAFLEEQAAVVRGLQGRKAQVAQKEDWQELGRGWCLGGEAFRERMLDKLEELAGPQGWCGYAGPEVRACDEQTAERLAQQALVALGLDEEDLSGLKKSDPRKRVVAWLLRSRTGVTNRWVSERLAMGHDVNVSQSTRMVREGASAELRRLQRQAMAALKIKA